MVVVLCVLCVLCVQCVSFCVSFVCAYTCGADSAGVLFDAAAGTTSPVRQNARACAPGGLAICY